MRNVILVSVIVFILALTGGYCIVWYAQASSLKHNVEDAIAKINKTRHYISYESIETSGFPSNLYVSIVKPHFKGRVDLLLKQIPPSKDAAGNTIPSPFDAISNWEEDDTLDGSIVFGVNALSDTYSLIIKGNSQEISKIADKTISLNHEQTAPAVCILQIQRSIGSIGTLWNFRSLAQDGPEFVKNVRKVDCNMSPKKTIDSVTKQLVASSGALRFYITNNIVSNAYQTRFYIKATDMELTPQGDIMLADYVHALNPGYAYPLVYSAYGKQNAEIDFTYNGAVNLDKKNTNPTIHVALNKFDITNNLYSDHMNFLLDNNTTADNRIAKLVFNSQANFSEQYNALLQNSLRGIIAQVETSKDPHLREVQAQFQKYTPDQLYSILYPSLFDLHSLGNIVGVVDFKYQGKPDLTNGNVTLGRFEMSATPYGIKASGAATLVQKIPHGANLTVDCKNCLQMIDDITGYMGRLGRTVAYFAPDKADALTIDPNKIDAVKKFLTALASSSDANLHYAIVSDPTTGTTVNNRPISDVMALANQYLGPYFQAQHPANYPQRIH